MWMLTLWFRGCVGCLRTKQGLRGIIFQKPCLLVSWQRVARSVLMWSRWWVTLRPWPSLVARSRMTWLLTWFSSRSRWAMSRSLWTFIWMTWRRPWLNCMWCSKQLRIALRRTPIMWWWFKRRRKRGSVGSLPGTKARKRFSMSPRALSLRQKACLAHLLMRNASTTIRRDIGSGTVRSTWRSRRRRREGELPLQV